MKIAITGASGNVGRQALAAFEDADHEITPITHDETEDIEGRIADVTEYESVSDALSGQDVALHLAANPSPEAEWEDVLGVNVDGTYNVYEAAVENDLDRLVFASTNHVSNMYNAASPDERESLIEDPDVIDPDDPPRPDSYYGVSKVAGEALGSYYAALHGLEVVNLRIGWLMDRSDLEETQDDTERRARFARAMWLSPGDCRNAIRGATTASLSENPVTVNVVSANDDRYLSLTHTIRGIDYRPRDNATEALGGDAR